MQHSVKYEKDTLWQQEILSWKDLISIPDETWKYDTWSRYGLEKLVCQGIELFHMKISDKKVTLPHNLDIHGPWVQYPKNKKRIKENCQEFVTYAARFSGWLSTIAEMPGITKLISRTVSANGVYSPYTVLDLYKLFEKFPSPHECERKYWKVLKRSKEILQNYGISPSYNAIAIAMTSGKKATGKMALRVAEETVKYLTQKMFGEGLSLIQARGLKEALTKETHIRFWAGNQLRNSRWNKRKNCWENITPRFASLREAIAYHQSTPLMKDDTDGVVTYIESDNFAIIHKVKIWEGFCPNGQKMYVCKQINTGRSYHSIYGENPKDIAKRCISAWRTQAELFKKNVNLVDFLNGNLGYCPLIYRNDSYNAGNCRPGTESWIESLNWGQKNYVPGIWLISKLDEWRVQNIVKLLYTTLTAK